MQVLRAAKSSPSILAVRAGPGAPETQGSLPRAAAPPTVTPSPPGTSRGGRIRELRTLHLANLFHTTFLLSSPYGRPVLSSPGLSSTCPARPPSKVPRAGLCRGVRSQGRAGSPAGQGVPLPTAQQSRTKGKKLTKGNYPIS